MTNYFENCTTPTEVKIRWRELSSIHHPDKGGDAETFHQVKLAYDAAMSAAVRPLQCAECRGSGKIFIGTGFSKLPSKCPSCKGQGKVYRS